MIVDHAGTKADCANITNLSRIAASSVLVEWEHHPSLTMPATRFNITISEYENSSLIAWHCIVSANGSTNGSYVYLVNYTSRTQLLCFTVSAAMEMRGSGPTMPGSGENMAADVTCLKECLPYSTF